MLEVFFSISMITVFFLYLISTIYSLRTSDNLQTNVLYENAINNLYILEKNGILGKLLDSYNLYALEQFISSLYPYTDKKVYIYDNSYVFFYVLDNYPNLDAERYVRFHFVFPRNLNNKSVVVKDISYQNLPTKVSFNYYYTKILYSLSSLSYYNCTYLEFEPQNLPYDIGDVKKILLYFNNLPLKNYSWTFDGNKILIKINEKIESGLNINNYLYIFVTNRTDELGKEESTNVNVNNCLAIASGNVELEFQKSSLGTVEFNYKPVTIPENGKFYFYLNFIANNPKFNSFINRDVTEAIYELNDSFVSIRRDLPLEYGLTFSEIPEKAEINKVFVAPYYNHNIYHELHLVIYD